MPLPHFNSEGDLPPGVHQATMDEVLARFGTGAPQRQAITARLREIYELAGATGKLDRLVLFGSYITVKPKPNDVDIVLVMSDDFDLYACDGYTRSLFDHQRAAKAFGASIFWIRPAMLLRESLEEFIAHWQVKRDRTLRGIVEIRV